MAQTKLDTLIKTVETKEDNKELYLNIKAYEYRNQLIVASEFVLSKLGSAGLAIVLGSGLGGFSEQLANKRELPYKDIPFLPTPSVVGHAGKIIMGELEGKNGNKRKVLCFAGRLHAYEGIPMYQCTFCARLAYFVGCHTIILTNAAGGAIKNQTPGSVVIMNDYVRDVYYNVMNHSRNDSMLGPKYCSGDGLFDKELIELFEKTAKDVKFPAYKGCYWWASGPAYETSTQVEYIVKSGGNAIGMSTVPSILASNGLGLRVGALSLCTNIAAGLVDEEISHEIVVAEAEKASKAFTEFVATSLLRIKDPPKWKPNILNSPKLINYNLPFIKNDDLFPRKYLATFNDLYKDIKFLRTFLTNILDLEMTDEFNVDDDDDDDNDNTTDDDDDDDDTDGKQDIDSPKSPSENPLIGQYTQSLMSDDGLLLTKNRKGPIVVWVVHEPFTYDKSCLVCPVIFPMDLLPGWKKNASSSSGKGAELYFGLDKNSNFIVVVTGLGLEGLRFDESNYFINLIYGVIGHKNVFFFNLFYAFNTNTLYSKTEDKQDNNNKSSTSNTEIYGLIRDAVDFGGGFPRYPFPLFPPTDYNTNISSVRLKYASFGDKQTKSLKMVLDCIKSSNVINNNIKNNIEYKYGYWPGPSFPTKTEINMTKQSNCNIIGVSDPFMTPMCRQLGCDGYTIAKIANNNTINKLLNENEFNVDETVFINNLTEKLIKKLSKPNEFCPFSPALKNKVRRRTIINDKLLESIKDVNVPQRTPQYLKIRNVKKQWNMMSEAKEYLMKYWNFEKKPIKNALFCSFSHLFEENEPQCVCSVNLAKIPGWKENFCGGYPYSHYHWNQDNPFEWYLKIFKYKDNSNKYYVCISPMFFQSSKIMSKRKKYLASFFKYSPMFWNLNYLVKVLWSLGFKSVNYFTHLMSNNKNKVKSNTLVCLNNFTETSKWNVLTGPNDTRIGPRFTPITNPFEYCDKFIKYSKDKYNKTINICKVTSLSQSNIVSTHAKMYYYNMGYDVSVCGLVPCVYQTQHAGMNKFVIGLVDYDPTKKLTNVDSFAQVTKMIEGFFLQIE